METIDLMPVNATACFCVPTEPQPYDGATLAIAVLDEVRGLDNMMRYAEEMLIACTLVIEREIGSVAARDVLKTAGKSIRKTRAGPIT